MRRIAVIAVVMYLALPAAGAGPGDAAIAAAADLATLGEHDRKFQGYLWTPTPVLTAPPSVAVAAGIYAELGDATNVLNYHTNGLSRKGAIRPLTRVSPNLWRADFRHYAWDREVWEKMARHNYVFNEPFPKKIVKVRVKGKLVRRTVTGFGPASWIPEEPMVYLIGETGSKTPIVLAPWWLVNSSRQLSLSNKQLGFGMYDWLGVKNRNDFLALAKVRLDETRGLEKDIREAVAVSKVARHGRQFELNPTVNGLHAFTLDTDNDQGKGNNPVQELKRGDFKHKAEEHFLPLPNKLPAFLLCDNEGNRQDSAPDFIGTDTSALNQSIDKRIHVGVACIRCHFTRGEVLLPVDGWARRNFRIDRLALNVPLLFKSQTPEERFALFEELQRQYQSLNFANELNQQKLAYRIAIREAAGIDAEELARRFARLYHAYADEPVTLEQACRELGYTAAEVVEGFNWYSNAVIDGVAGIHPQLGALVKVDPRTGTTEPIPRLQWEGLYAEAQKVMLVHRNLKNKEGEQK